MQKTDSFFQAKFDEEVAKFEKYLRQEHALQIKHADSARVLQAVAGKRWAAEANIKYMQSTGLVPESLMAGDQDFDPDYIDSREFDREFH